MPIWNPWRGCHKYSEGCKYCYIHKGDSKRGVDTNEIVKTADFDLPIRKNKDGSYKIKPGKIVYLCFSSDFLLEDTDKWRKDCWRIIKERPDLKFLFLTKRIERLALCAPQDWGNGYDNVIIGCTIENQDRANSRLAIFNDLHIKHKVIICQPLLERVDLSNFLNGVEKVVVGGESDFNARILNFDWVLDIRHQCIEANVDFEFRQCGSNFIKDGKSFRLRTRNLITQAKKANIDWLRH
jgi:protein gp37